MDDSDYEVALSGVKDLAGFILDGADFSARQMRESDFRRAHIKNCLFVESDLTGSNFLEAEHANANFSAAKLVNCKFSGAIFRINFSNADLRGCELSGLFHECTFVGSNISGVDFSKSKFNTVSDFSNVIFDSKTNFAGAQAVRPMLAFPVFSRYDLRRGILVEKPDEGLSSQALDAISGMRAVLKEASSRVVDASNQIGIGHNQPPEQFVISSADFAHIRSDIEAAINTIEVGENNTSLLERAIDGMKAVSASVSRWVAQKANLFADEVVKTAGKGAAYMFAAYLTGILDHGIKLVEVFMQSIGK